MTDVNELSVGGYRPPQFKYPPRIPNETPILTPDLSSTDASTGDDGTQAEQQVYPGVINSINPGIPFTPPPLSSRYINTEALDLKIKYTKIVSENEYLDEDIRIMAGARVTNLEEQKKQFIAAEKAKL